MFAFKLYLELYAIITAILRFEIQINEADIIDLLENKTTLLSSIYKRHCKGYWL